MSKSHPSQPQQVPSGHLSSLRGDVELAASTARLSSPPRTEVRLRSSLGHAENGTTPSTAPSTWPVTAGGETSAGTAPGTPPGPDALAQPARSTTGATPANGGASALVKLLRWAEAEMASPSKPLNKRLLAAALARRDVSLLTALYRHRG